MPELRFWHYLALSLGGCTVAELQQRMSAEEFTQWQAYYDLEPFGEQAAAWRSGMLASTIVNSNPFLKSRRMEPKDFMLKPKLVKPKSTDELKSIFTMWNKVLGGSDGR